MIYPARPASQGRPAPAGRSLPPGAPVHHANRQLRMAAEIRDARETMTQLGYSQVDIREEIERIRERYARRP